MTDQRAASSLAEHLSAMKTRSGRSYYQIAHRTNLSKATVHRYCSGRTFPRTFGVVESIAEACRAEPSELTKLYNLWVRENRLRHQQASSDRVEPATPVRSLSTQPLTETQVGSGDPDGPGKRESLIGKPPVGRHSGPERAVRSSRITRTNRLLRLVGVTVFLAATMTSAAGQDAFPPAGLGVGPLARQWIPGPVWAHAPDRIPPRLFGVTIQSNSGAMPSFQVDAVRLWDSRTRWSNIQPRREVFDWLILDRMVAGAERAGLPVLLTFGGTPEWASPGGPRTPYTDGSRTSPPRDMSDWDRFVHTVVTRYRGRIEAYELWDYANSRHFYSGSTATLVEMVRRASQIIKMADPEATVGCPSFGDLWEADGQEALYQFAAAGGYAYCDAAAVKLHPRNLRGRPEEMVELARLVDRIMHRAGVHLPMWATGPNFGVPNVPPLDEEKAKNYGPRFYLAGLYARFERMYFYNWGGRNIPLVLQAEGGPPTLAALRTEELQRWLAGSRITSCGYGTADALPPNVWQCRFLLDSKNNDRHPAAIRWTDSGTATMTAESRALAVHHLDGSVQPVSAGDILAISEQPILVEYQKMV